MKIFRATMPPTGPSQHDVRRSLTDDASARQELRALDWFRSVRRNDIVRGFVAFMESLYAEVEGESHREEKAGRSQRIDKREPETEAKARIDSAIGQRFPVLSADSSRCLLSARIRAMFYG